MHVGLSRRYIKWVGAGGALRRKAIDELLRKDCNWRECESYLNGLPYFSTVIDNQEIAFIHVKSKHEEAKPLILTHGWPGSVIDSVNVIEPLVNPIENGGSEKDAFHLVLPTIPGFGFAEKPSVNGWGIEKVALAWTELMRRLV